MNATTKLVNKMGGNILSTMTLVVSADGKTLTITTAGKDAKELNIDSVAVYDEQYRRLRLRSRVCRSAKPA